MLACRWGSSASWSTAERVLSHRRGAGSPFGLMTVDRMGEPPEDDLCLFTPWTRMQMDPGVATREGLGVVPSRDIRRPLHPAAKAEGIECFLL